MTVRLFFHFLRIIFKSRMEYRADFFLGVFGQILGYAADYVILWLLIQSFSTIDGWTWPELAFLVSLNILSYAIGASFTYTPTANMEELIRTGDFDKYLTKPLNTLMYLIASLFNFGYIAHITISLSILLWSVTALPVQWTFLKILYLICILIGGAMIQAGALILVSCWGFLFTKSQYLFSLYFKMKEFISYPMSIYAPFIQICLTWIIPLAFINYYPSLFLLGKQEGVLVYLTPLLGPVFLTVVIKLWFAGVNRYQGTGS